MSADELFKLKIAALMHDPPHKPYLLARGKPHEKEARELVKRALGNKGREVGDRYLDDPRCRLADRLASTFDRWVLSVLMGGRYVPSAFRCTEVKLKNVVSPWFEVEPKPGILYDEGKYKDYVNELQGCLGSAESWRDRYLLLYLLYELAWICKGLGVGPADTRTPTHTVFDHNYATAMIINWTSREGKVRGCMVGLDVAGVQDFVRSSRKVRDAWVSSYVVSALMWHAVEEVVEALGPDVVLMPTLRANPFYLHWLKGKFGEHELLYAVRELVFLTEDVRGMYEQLGIPPYPVVPGRATLVLPPWEEVEKMLEGARRGGLRKYFARRFEDGWRRLWEAVETYARSRLEVEDGAERALWELVVGAFKHYRDAWKDSCFDKVPPLELRVEDVKVSGDPGRKDLWRLYDDKYRELVAKLGLTKYTRRDPSTRLGLYELTRKAFDGHGLGFPEESRRGFEYCTSCGRIPALVVLPRDEEEYDNRLEKEVSSLRYLGGKERERALARLKIVFSPGERLCPWCFLKRVLSLEPRLLDVLLLGLKDYKGLAKKLSREPKPFSFPSTAHVASARLYERLLELRREPGKLEGLLSKVEVGKHLPFRLARKPAERWAWTFMSKLGNELDKRGEGLKLLLYSLYSLDPEELWFSEERREPWERLLSDAGLGGWLWRYYALVKADGDSVGDMLEGEPAAFLDPSAEKAVAREFLGRYIESSCEGDFKKFVRSVLSEEERVAESWAQRLSSELNVSLNEATERIRRVARAFKALLDKELRIPVSPAYHVAVSSALMRSALADVAIVAALDGFTAYAGGDDLLAFVPVDRAFDVARGSRRAYGGFGQEEAPGIPPEKGVSFNRGFLKLRKAHLPMLPGAGKSYCIYLAHYHYPLQLVISSASRLVEEAKEEYKLEYISEDLRSHSSRKDVTAVAYSPRGAEELALLPLSWRRPTSVEDSHEIASALLGSMRLLGSIDDRVGCADREVAWQRRGARSGECEIVLSRGTLYHLTEEDAKELFLAGARKALKDPDAARDVYEMLDAAFLALLKRGLRKGGGEREAEEVYSRVFKALSGKDYARFGLVKKGSEEGAVASNIADAARLLSSGMR